MTRLDLPDPDRPVTQVKVPSGIVAVTFWRLLARAPFSTRSNPLPGRRCVGTSIFFAPVR